METIHEKKSVAKISLDCPFNDDPTYVFHAL
jgi:hypothetical protein